MSRLPKITSGKAFGFLLTAFIAFSLALPFLHAVNLSGEILMAALYALLFSLLAGIYVHLPYRLRFLAPLLTLALVIGSAFLLKGSAPARVLSFLRSLGSGVSFYHAVNLYNDALLPVLMLVLSLFARLIMEGEPGFSLPLLTVPVFMLWFLGEKNQVSIFFPAVMSLPLLYVYTAQHDREGLLQTQPRLQKSRALILALALAFLAFSLTPAERKTQPRFEAFANDIRTRLEDLFFFTATRNMFTLDSQGYQPMGEKGLGGRPDISLKPVMTVQTGSKVYLRGTALDVYTGRSWYDSLSSQRYSWLSSRYEQTRKTLFDFNLPQNERNEGQEATVTLLSDLPSTLFVPQRVRSLSPGAGMVPYFNASSEIFITHDLKSGDSYSFRHEPYVAGEGRTDALAARLNAGSAAAPNDILKNYTALPEHLPQDGLIAELAREIVGGETNPYRQALLILRYLRQNYSYTTEVPDAPVNQDFAAHFLFELKEGYCTYFATAMTVLARSQNLPARYIEGFVADPQGQGSVTLNGTNAHAWTEIFFPELGWVVFDATAQVGQNNNDSGNEGNESPQAEPSPSPSPSPSPEPSEEPENAPTPTPPKQEGPSPEPSPQADHQNEPDSPPRPPFPWWILLVLALIGLIVWRAIAEDPLRRERRMKPGGAVLMMYWQEWLRLNKSNRRGILDSETPLSYISRLEDAPGMEETAGSVSALVYGRHEPDLEEIVLSRKLYQDAWNKVKWVRKPGLLLGRALLGIKTRLAILPMTLKDLLARKPRKKRSSD